MTLLQVAGLVPALTWPLARHALTADGALESEAFAVLFVGIHYLGRFPFPDDYL